MGTDVPQAVSSAYNAVTRSTWTERLARLGSATGGAVYIIIGVLAVMVAVEGRGRIVGPEGAIEQIGNRPFGEILLVAVAVGLLGYALWRFIEAISDYDRDGSDWKGILTRAGILFSGLAYGSLSIFAARRALGGHARADDGARHWTATLLQHPLGGTLLVLVGFALIVAGIAQAIYAARGRFRQKLARWNIDSSDRGWLVRIGGFGYAAQSVILFLVGVFLLHAVWTSNPSKAHGLDGALRALAHTAYGPWLLGFVAAGLTCYGTFMLWQARCAPMRGH